MRLRSILLAVCFVPGVVFASGMDDPFPIRDIFPFHLLFLDQTPAGASIQPILGARVSWNAAYVNTTVATDDLIHFYAQNGQEAYDGRVTLDALKTMAEAQPSRTAFVFDGETLRTVLLARVGVAKRFEFGVEVPFLSQGSGFMDSSIDSFHERFGLPSGGRTAFAHNQFRAGYVGDGETVYLDEGPSSLRLGDVVLSGTVAILAERGRSPLLSVTLSAKAPSGDYRALAGSGSWDYGAALRFTKRWVRSSAHAGYAYNAVGEWRLAPGLPLQNTRSLFGAFTYAVTPDTGLVLQVLRNAGPFPFRSGNDLGKVAMGFSGGFRHRLPGGFQLEWSLIENIDPYYNNYDVGAYFGLSYSPGSTPPTMTGVPTIPDQISEKSGA